MKLIKNIQIYAPENLGVKDVLISDSKIEKIDNHIELSYPIETIDGTRCILTPGLIDRHVHITGGGGEAGFISRARPIDVQEILDAGITTVVIPASNISFTSIGLALEINPASPPPPVI